MNVDAIRAYCLAFPRATEKLQWGDDLCFKIAGKIFAMLGLDNPRLCFKCSPEVFADLATMIPVRRRPAGKVETFAAAEAVPNVSPRSSEAKIGS